MGADYNRSTILQEQQEEIGTVTLKETQYQTQCHFG